MKRASGREEAGGPSPSERIDARIEELGDWRGRTLSRLRALIRQVDPDVQEEWKWRGVPVWSRNGILCTGEVYKSAVKVTFARGAALDDPAGLFNAGLEGNTRRAIDLHEGGDFDAKAFQALVRAAIRLNTLRALEREPVGAMATTAIGRGKRSSPAASRIRPAAAKPVLLAGGNPQIPKGDGDGPVQAYLAAMPGWKREVGRRLDALVVRTVPDVRKAVRWNSPFYGVEGQGWFLSFHCFTRYVKVTFFRGTSLRPLPPGESRDENARFLDVHEDDELDETLLAKWIRQAAARPGWVP